MPRQGSGNKDTGDGLVGKNAEKEGFPACPQGQEGARPPRGSRPLPTPLTAGMILLAPTDPTPPCLATASSAPRRTNGVHIFKILCPLSSVTRSTSLALAGGNFSAARNNFSNIYFSDFSCHFSGDAVGQWRGPLADYDIMMLLTF